MILYFGFYLFSDEVSLRQQQKVSWSSTLIDRGTRDTREECAIDRPAVSSPTATLGVFLSVWSACGLSDSILCRLRPQAEMVILYSRSGQIPQELQINSMADFQTILLLNFPRRLSRASAALS